MTYTISITPSAHPGKVTATSSDGHTLTSSMCLLDGARYWLGNVRPRRYHRDSLVKRPRPLGTALNYRPRRRAAEKRDELASLQLIEVHPIPHPWRDRVQKNIEATSDQSAGSADIHPLRPQHGYKVSFRRSIAGTL
jgi:hypothetical protein